MANLSAIIFDLDGVLVNTFDLHYQAWKAVAESGGRSFTPADMETLRGVRRDQCLKIIFDGIELTSIQIASFLRIKNEAYIKSLFQQKPHDLLIDNTIELITSAQSLGLKLGVASSSVNAQSVLEHVGLTHVFHVIAGGKSVSRSKPHPDIFVWVAGAMRVYPQHALVIEDSHVGVVAAKDAGMSVIGVSNPETASQADRYFPSLSAINLSNLLSDLDLTIKNPLQRSYIGDRNVRN